MVFSRQSLAGQDKLTNREETLIVSSNDRHNRSGGQRQPPAPLGPQYDDDLLYEDDWEIETDFDAPNQSRQPSPRRTAPRQSPPPASEPSNQGTAAQIDRLRRNIRQQTSPPAASRPARPIVRSQTQHTGRYAPPQDDQIVDDEPRSNNRVYRQQPPQARTQTRRDPESPRQTSHSPNDRYYDDYDSYNPDSYNDGGYEDDFGEYDAPGRTARAARPAPQIRMPSISRPTLPAAIANADLVNDAPALGFIGAGLVSLAAMAIMVANRVDTLAPRFATHVSASGVLENFRDEAALWNLPLMAAMFTLMGIVMAWFISPIDRFASRFVLVGALVTQFVAWVALFRIL